MMGNFMGYLFAYAGDLEGDEEEDEEDMFPLERDTTTPAHSKFDEFLDKIFVHLDLSALKNCRVVCRHWCSIASAEVKLRDLIKIELHQDKGRPIFRTPCTRRWLNDLNVELEREKGFTLLCTKFEFHGNMGLQDVRQFFKLHGSQMTVLVVKNLDHNFTRWSVLQSLLQEAPKVHDLTVLGTNFDFDAYSTQDNVDMMIVALPKLTIFRMDYETTNSTLYKILAGAPNLTRVENFDWSHVDVFLNSARTLNNIRELNFTQNGPLIPGEVENFVHIFPPDKLVLNLGIPHPRQFHPEDRWCNAAFSTDLIKILTTIKDSLETLSILPLGWCQDEYMVFPPLLYLKNLKISATSKDPSDIFPFSQTQQPKDIFPKLENIILDFDDYSQEFWTKSFPNESKFQMVKQLNVLNMNQPVKSIKWTLEQMRGIFPNLSKLRFGCEGLDSEFIEAILNIWNGAKIESMEFEGIQVAGDFEVDAVLTGIQKEDCGRLAESLKGNTKLTEEQVDNVLKYLKGKPPSIRNFNGLKTLKMSFKRIGDYDGNPVSIVSYAYGFSLSPQLMVTIETN